MPNPADITIPTGTPISGANIVIPSPPAGSYAALRKLLDSCGPNKNHRAVALIGACIGDGIATKREIIGAGIRLGLNPRHVAAILDKDTGSDPERHRWRRDENGVYSPLN